MRNISTRQIPHLDNTVRRSSRQEGVIGRHSADEDDSRVCLGDLPGVGEGEGLVGYRSGERIKSKRLTLVRCN